MERIEQKVKIMEVNKKSKLDKKGLKVDTKTVKLSNNTATILITLKGNYADKFNEQDRGSKFSLILARIKRG